MLNGAEWQGPFSPANCHTDQYPLKGLFLSALSFSNYKHILPLKRLPVGGVCHSNTQSCPSLFKDISLKSLIDADFT